MVKHHQVEMYIALCKSDASSKQRRAVASTSTGFQPKNRWQDDTHRLWIPEGTPCLPPATTPINIPQGPFINIVRQHSGNKSQAPILQWPQQGNIFDINKHMNTKRSMFFNFWESFRLQMWMSWTRKYEELIYHRLINLSYIMVWFTILYFTL